MSRREHLVDMLEVLLADEYNASNIVRLSEDEIVDMIINLAFYYKDKANN
jgi:cytochrome P450